MNLVDQTDVSGLEYVFPANIYKYYIDTIHGYLTVQTRDLKSNGKFLKNKGKIFLYDLNKHKLMWSQKMSFGKYSLIQHNSTMVLANAKKSYVLDINTGFKVNEINRNIYMISQNDKLGLTTLNGSVDDESILVAAVNLENGRIKWTRNVNTNYGISDVKQSGDSALLFISGGLHKIRLNDGRGWDYYTVTGKKDYRGTVAANAAGIAAGLLTGSYFITTGYSLIIDINSNVLEDENCIYFASKEMLVQIDKRNGKVLWKSSLPEESTSKSYLFKKNGTIHLINTGYARKSYRPVKIGSPFIAAYNSYTGKLKYMKDLENARKPIYDYACKNGRIFIIHENRLITYSMETGEFTGESELVSEDDYGHIRYFTGANVYINKGNDFYENLSTYDTTKLYVYTNNRKILAISEKLDMGNVYNEEDYNICFLEKNGLRFISNEDNIFIVNSAGMKIAELELDARSQIIGNTLYDIKDNRLQIIDIREMLENSSVEFSHNAL